MLIQIVKHFGEGTVSHQYVPCDHKGPCGDPAVCSCARNFTWCEKYCGCDPACKLRFTGCSCQGCRCQTKACPCYAASRECDPDLCTVCQSDIPDHELEGERLCKNVSIRYRLRKVCVLLCSV
jgi:histone-lysine N-methyltransferase EZH2